MKRLFSLFALVLAGISQLPAATTLFPYYSYTDWANAISGTGIMTETFDTGGLAAPGLAVMSPTAGSIECGSGNCYWNDTVGSGDTTTWNFNNGQSGGWWVTAWGGYFTIDAGGPGLKFTPTGYGGTGEFNSVIVQSTDLIAANGNFFGFVSNNAHPFWAVTTDSAVTGQTQHYTLDNMVYNPEPSTVLMLASGLLGLACVLKRRRRSA